MADTTTPTLHLTKPEVGASDDTWGAKTNANWDIVDAWAAGGGGNAPVVISDTPPSSPRDGMLWWESDSGRLYIRYNDGNSTQWVQVSSL